MKKRVMSLLLVMLLVFSLLPAAAMAAGEPVSTVAAKTEDGLNMTKSLKMEPDGSYTITLESWATGVVHSEVIVQPKPTDFVLVLDLSSSMGETQQSSKLYE